MLNVTSIVVIYMLVELSTPARSIPTVSGKSFVGMLFACSFRLLMLWKNSPPPTQAHCIAEKFATFLWNNASICSPGGTGRTVGCWHKRTAKGRVSRMLTLPPCRHRQPSYGHIDFCALFLNVPDVCQSSVRHSKFAYWAQTRSREDAITSLKGCHSFVILSFHGEEVRLGFLLGWDAGAYAWESASSPRAILWSSDKLNATYTCQTERACFGVQISEQETTLFVVVSEILVFYGNLNGVALFSVTIGEVCYRL